MNETKRNHVSFPALSLAIGALCVAPLAWSQSSTQPSTKNGEWPTYAGDLKGTRYSPLDQINASNFNQLEVAWRFKTDNFGARPEFKLEGTPLMVNGVIYTTAGTRRSVVALDAKTGELIWAHSMQEGARGAAAPRQLSGRGVAYWTDGKGDDRVVYVTTGYRMVELNAHTGQPIPSFATGGVLDLKVGVVKGTGQQIDLETGEIGVHSTPIVVKDVVIVGSAMKEGMTIVTHNNTKGLVRAFDVRTGKKIWQFNTIPKPGEFGNDTWENNSWAVNGNTGVWTQITVDEDLGLVYLPVESPSSDYYGGHRPGNNLFGESLVCVDLKTGQRKWHFQFVHHPIWDMDISSAPILADVNVNGRPVKVVAVPSKQCFLYVFDRVTGQPIWPIEERPVPQSTVPGEKTSPTQPYPTKPPAYCRNYIRVPDDLIDFTPEMRATPKTISRAIKSKACSIRRWSAIRTVISPPSSSATPTAAPTGRAADTILRRTSCMRKPTSPLLRPSRCVNRLRDISDMRYVLGRQDQAYRLAEAAGSGDYPGAPPPKDGIAIPNTAKPVASTPSNLPNGNLSVQGLPIIKPPYGVISAINLDKGELAWKVPYGETPDNVRNHPALKGMNIGNTGQGGSVGLVVTKTLVILGDSRLTTTPQHPRGAMLRAYDKATGKEVGAVWMPAPQSGSPMTYMLDGKQYIVVAVSGGPYSGEYIAFALPQAE